MRPAGFEPRPQLRRLMLYPTELRAPAKPPRLRGASGRKIVRLEAGLD